MPDYREAVEAPVEPEHAVLGVPECLRGLRSVWSLDAKIEWLIADMLPMGGITLLSAASGTGKTWVAHAIAGAVARGEPFLGLDVKKRPVLYLDRENPLAVVKRNLKDLGIERTDDLHIWGGWCDEAALGPDDPRLVKFAETHQPLLIWDSLVRFHTGDEQSAKDTSAFMTHFRNLANVGANILLQHHTGKAKTSKEYRGSSDIEAAVDMAYTLKGTPQNGKLHCLRMDCFKSRFAPAQDFGLEFQAGEGFVRVEVPRRGQKPSADAVLQKFIVDHPGANGKEIKEAARLQGISKGAADAYLKTWPNVEKGKGRELRYYAREEEVLAA